MLTKGSIQRMSRNDTSVQPRLQVLDVKKIITGQQGERFRLVLSDGEYYIQGMLASQCTELVHSNELKKFSVIHLKEFVCNNISGKKICVVINCDVVQQMNAGIGKPKNVLNPNQSNPPSAASPNRNNQNRPAPPQNQQPFVERNNMNQNANNYNNNNGWNNNQNNANRSWNNNQNNNNNAYPSDSNIQPVSSLNPYQNSWKIKVRCTNKDNMRHYSNQKGDGKFFGVDLLDKHGTEIRAVAFNEAAEKFFAVFEKNRVFLISKGQVRLARKGYSHIKNDYSITLNADAEVVPVHADENEIQQQKFKFVKIAQIGSLEPQSFVDVIGIIIDVGPVSTIISNKTQKSMKRRNLKVADSTAKIEVTLWNESAVEFNEDIMENNKHPVIALKGCKVSGYGGRSLSASGLIVFHPDIPETRGLLQWVATLESASGGGSIAKEMEALTELSNGGGGMGVNDSKTPRRTFAEVKEMKLGEDNGSKQDNKKADYFTVVATITTIAHTQDKKPWYEANPDLKSEAKNAKVTSMGDGKWRCEKNGKVYNSYVPRYILRFCATDFTGNIWLTSFNEVAEKILKKTAIEAEQLYNNNHDAYEQLFKDAQFKKYVFKCKAFSDVWEDSTRIRYDCIAVEIADSVQESEKLVEKIQFLQNLKNNYSNNQNNNNNNNY